MFGLGSIIEKVADALGAPEWVGDVGGLIADVYTGNWAGVVEGGIDLAENAGIDIKSMLPEPLYRAGMMYLQAQGGKDFSEIFKGEDFVNILKDEGLRQWAGDDGMKLINQFLGEKGVRA